MAHERLWHGGVDAVHRHLISVVGRPAEREFREVAGADDEAPLFIGDVHQHLRAFARLRVFKGHVIFVLFMADVAEVEFHRFRYVDASEIDAERLAEQFRVALRPCRGAEAGHRHGEDAGARALHQVRRPDGDEQRQAGVKAARNADDGLFRARVFKPFFEAVSLHREDRRGSPAALRAVVWDEGPPWDEALREVRIRCLHLKRYGPVSRRPFFGIGRQPFAFLCEQLRVNDRGTVSRSEGLAFGQQTPVLRDKVVSAEYHVGRRFSPAGVGVDVGADKARRLSQDEGAAVFRFADRFVARGKVGDD